MAAKQYYVYRNLNDPADCIVINGDEVALGIYEEAAGPFKSREEAERKADELRRQKSA